jgi:glutamine amidotransferase
MQGQNSVQALQLNDMVKNAGFVGIIDYGMGNLFSIERVLNHLGYPCRISADPAVLSGADKLILPGVGAFGDGMRNLVQRSLVEFIKESVLSGKDILGICLGMQLLMTESEEFGRHQGLNLVSGKVVRLAGPQAGERIYKIPHVGWNRIDFRQCTLLKDLPQQAFVYFVHSYAVYPDDPADIIARTAYGNNDFCSALRRQNISGCQFHPEISGETGLQIIKNFLNH